MDSPAPKTTSDPLGRGEPHPDAGTPCAEPERRALLVPYALGRLGEDEALDFEVHLLMCETCFKDVKILDKASRLIREHRRKHPEADDLPDESEGAPRA